jgi:ABC-type uncharacterized transport system permease subunit
MQEGASVMPSERPGSQLPVLCLSAASVLSCAVTNTTLTVFLPAGMLAGAAAFLPHRTNPCNQAQESKTELPLEWRIP